jgi:quinol monooxygenase YgiN
MTELRELRQTMGTAFVHCKPGGVALFVPDHEQYRTDAAFELHRTAPHLAGYRAEMKELVARPSEIELYRSLTA